MFVVPGWNVSAQSLTQEQLQDSKSSVGPKSTTAISTSTKRKRPRDNEEKSRKIAGNELEKLWNDRFGGNPTGEVQKKSKSKKKQKGAYNATHNHKAPDEQVVEKSSISGTSPGRSSSPSPDTRAVLQNGDGESLSKTKRKRLKKERRKEHQPLKPQSIDVPPSGLLPPQPPPPPVTTTLTPLQLKMRNKLTSARFRHLNQTLYTTPSSTSLELFTSSPNLFSEYHAGFTLQVQSSWPTNPVSTFIASIFRRGTLPLPNNNTPTPPFDPPLPRRKTLSCTIADLGCGDAPLAHALSPQLKHLHLQIHSYDLFAANKHVTVADIARLPLRDGEADIAIFSLSLMGTNWIDFVEESWRILRGDGKGELWVAEVKSRFGRRKRKDGVVQHSVGHKKKMAKKSKASKKQSDIDEDEDEYAGEELFASSTHDKDDAEAEADETDISPFVTVLQRRGFRLQDSSVDKSNKMFVSMIFHKSGVPTAGKYQGWKWNGKEYARQRDAKMRFVGGDEHEVSREEEGKVLKPCVYKSR